MIELSKWLAERGAMNDFVTWALPYGADWERAWNECPRADWLLALAARGGSERAALVRAAAACARLALEVLEDEAAAPAIVGVVQAEAWARGDAKLDTAYRASLDAMLEAPDPLLSAGARAAICVLLSIEEPEHAAGAAAAAVETAILQAGDCATMAAVSYAQRRGAELVREIMPAPPAPT